MTISINSRKFLGEYIDTQNRERFPEGLLWSGILLSGALLTIFCLAGGTVMLVTIGCILILGSAFGLVLERYGSYTILSCIDGVVSLTPINKHNMPKAA